MVTELPFNFATFTGAEIRGVATGGYLLSGQGGAGESRRGGGVASLGLAPGVALAGRFVDEAGPSNPEYERVWRGIAARDIDMVAATNKKGSPIQF